MTDQVLWKRITKTDLMGMTGEAAPSNTGGGAMHIPLGVDQPHFPICGFLNIDGCKNIEIQIEAIPGLIPQSTMFFSCNPSRRGGEWRIARQYHDRYPLWMPKFGFPSQLADYSGDNQPIIMIFKIADKFYARFCMSSSIEDLNPPLALIIRRSRTNKGIIDYTDDLGSFLSLNIPAPMATERMSAGAGLAVPTGELPRRAICTISRIIRDSSNGTQLKKLWLCRNA